MTERVTIEGRDLAVTRSGPGAGGFVDIPFTGTGADQKRRRPPPTVATGDGRAKSTGRTFEEIMRDPNPYWDDNGHRIMQDSDPYVGKD